MDEVLHDFPKLHINDSHNSLMQSLFIWASIQHYTAKVIGLNYDEKYISQLEDARLNYERGLACLNIMLDPNKPGCKSSHAFQKKQDDMLSCFRGTEQEQEACFQINPEYLLQVLTRYLKCSYCCSWYYFQHGGNNGFNIAYKFDLVLKQIEQGLLKKQQLSNRDREICLHVSRVKYIEFLLELLRLHKSSDSNEVCAFSINAEVQGLYDSSIQFRNLAGVPSLKDTYQDQDLQIADIPLKNFPSVEWFLIE